MVTGPGGAVKKNDRGGCRSGSPGASFPVRYSISAARHRHFTAACAPSARSRPCPILLQRTPYSIRPYGAEDYPDGLQPLALFGKGGYIFVYQDVRGRWMSEGEFVHMRPHIARKKRTDIDESTDAYDTIDWLLKHVPGHNGRVGLWGVS